MASLLRSRPCLATLSSSRHQQHRCRWGLQPCFATEGGQKPPEAGPSPVAANAADEEARIEALEASLRKAKGGARRQIPIRNVTPRQQEPSSTRAEWKEGKLFPEGWEQMSLGEKLSELYLGQRGILYWANQAAWWSVCIVGGAWVLFRFVGPALGLYKLDGDLTPPV